MEKPFTITIEEASERTGIAQRTLRELVRAGKIRATKPGKLILVYWESLVDYLERNKVLGPKAS